MATLYLGIYIKFERSMSQIPVLKITVVWDVAPYSLVYMYLTIWHCIPQDNNLHIRQPKNLISQKPGPSLIVYCDMTPKSQNNRVRRRLCCSTLCDN
jgi:hypothetical protein